MIKLLERMEKANLTWKGDLEFFNRWEFFTKGKPLLLRRLVTNEKMALSGDVVVLIKRADFSRSSGRF